MNCVIRTSFEEDVAAVQSIRRHHVLYGTSSFEEVSPSVDELKDRRTDILEYGLPYLVAELNGEIAGHAYTSPYRSCSACRFTIENSVYLDHRLSCRGTSHRRCGFVHVEVLRAVGFKFGHSIDTILMQRALGPEAAPEILPYEPKRCSHEREAPLA